MKNLKSHPMYWLYNILLLIYWATLIPMLIYRLIREEGFYQRIKQSIGFLPEELKDKKVTVKMKAGEGGRTFGSVSTKEIAVAAKAQLGMELDKKKMQLPEPIRTFGVTEVAIKLHPKVVGKFNVHVVEE